MAEARAAADTDWLVNASVAAYAGIGNPRRFFALLESLGAKLAVRRVFPDHHPFSEREAQGLLRLAEQASAQLVTTEKDLVRLLGATGARAELAARSRALPIRLWLADEHMETLRSLVQSLPRQAQPHSAAGGAVA
jgi:tetraacyldisaccharide 4'-kinase